ncbi:hypothetical protein RSOLAG22IIIB_10621 [Rhizoctonia solani]|uniref:Protein kinase domain-containing protein n=1 Tax=Rhizoctonia solani TaxID=456999 RepID=A0A0K6G4C2_9AGAM|nr:hypothetical protein RSOLAG22IIIB_10621 [Rhizoctonia solani]
MEGVPELKSDSKAHETMNTLKLESDSEACETENIPKLESENEILELQNVPEADSDGKAPEMDNTPEPKSDSGAPEMENIPKFESDSEAPEMDSISKLESDSEAPEIENMGQIDQNMSLKDMFDRLLHHGCVDLSSQMDPEQASAAIMNGGGFGDIWKGKLYNGNQVAIKAWRSYMIEQCEYKTLKRATREIYFWSKMEHDNVHPLIGVVIFKDCYLGMVSAWMDNGNLHDYMRNNPCADKYQLCTQVASGLAYMHKRKMVHGDLKAMVSLS